MNILLFDVDGTLCDSGKKIETNMSNLLNELIKNNYLIGIVGGGTFDKIIYQLDKKIKPHYIFSECGSVYHKLDENKLIYELIYINNLRLEPEYIKINKLVKTCLKFISETNDYLISGNFIDLRNGLIYISLVGMVATDDERKEFIKLDNIKNYRNNLLEILKNQAKTLELEKYIDISLGGSVGIAIYPKKWNKKQVLNILDSYTDKIYFFGDKYLPDGNDYELLSCGSIIPHPVDSPEDTYKILEQILNSI